MHDWYASITSVNMCMTRAAQITQCLWIYTTIGPFDNQISYPETLEHALCLPGKCGIVYWGCCVQCVFDEFLSSAVPRPRLKSIFFVSVSFLCCVFKVGINHCDASWCVVST